MSEPQKATIRPTDDGSLYRVFVGHWAFSMMDFDFHEKSKAQKIKRLFDGGDVNGAMREALSE